MCCFTKPLTWGERGYLCPKTNKRERTIKLANYALQFSLLVQCIKYQTNNPTTWRKAGTSFHFSSSSPTGLASSCWEPSCQSSPICKAKLSDKGQSVSLKVNLFLGRSNYILLLHQQGQTTSWALRIFWKSPSLLLLDILSNLI